MTNCAMFSSILHCYYVPMYCALYYWGTGMDTKMTRIKESRNLRVPIPVDLEFMLSSSGKIFISYVHRLLLHCITEWSIVDAFFSPLCDCLPQDYQSTIEKLKSFQQFADVEQQRQLESLIPAALTDISAINEKILTFLVMNLCYDASSGGITRLCDIMEQLIEFSESTSCVQEIRCGMYVRTYVHYCMNYVLYSMCSYSY